MLTIRLRKHPSAPYSSQTVCAVRQASAKLYVYGQSDCEAPQFLGEDIN